MLSNLWENYERGPKDIERRSFDIIRETLSCYAIDERLLEIVVRVVHAGADFSLANLVESHNGAHCPSTRAASGRPEIRG